MNSGVASLDVILYVCGGIAGETKMGSKKVFAHNPKTITWQEYAPVIRGRAALCAVAADQHIYAISGRGEDGVSTDTVERFDPKSNKWVLVSSMKERRKLSCGASFKKRIFVFGGNSRSKHSAEMYDIREDQWQMIQNMQVPRRQAGAAVIEGIIYINGGYRPSSFAPEEHKRMIECYDPSTEQWADKGSFPYEELVSRHLCLLSS